tara:strand:+ start:132586 stop:133278 length:693 start_codon:yes stop_codon:yes gene_type:complete
MNARLLGLAAITAAALSVNVYAATALKTDNDKLSYTLGFQMGSGFKSQDMKLNPGAVEQGIQDGLSGATPAITTKQQQAVIMQMQKQAVAKAQAKMQTQSKGNISKGDAFLKANAKKPGVKTTANGLQYKIVTAGKGAKPGPTDKVTVKYTGKLLDGTVFDASSKHGGTASFQVNQVIPGWTQALQMMHTGATWELFIPASLAYGNTGVPGTIPPGSTLIFDVTLVSVDK